MKHKDPIYHLRTSCSAVQLTWNEVWHVYPNSTKVTKYNYYELQICTVTSLALLEMYLSVTLAGLKCVCVYHLLTPPLALH